MSNNLGWVEVSTQLLGELLHTPYNASIIGADFKHPGIVRLLFCSPDLPDGDGEIPTLHPTITKPKWDWNLASGQEQASEK